VDVDLKSETMRFLFLILALFFFGLWAVSLLAFHIAGGLIHLLLVVGVIAVIIHFVRAKPSA
jgi:hypothetical protein